MGAIPAYVREAPPRELRLLGMQLHQLLTLLLLTAIAVACWRGAGGPVTPVCPPPAACPKAAVAAAPQRSVSAAKYDLSHLKQPAEQRVLGPVQDDEALLLYAITRGMRCRTAVEIGGLSGYSGRNFLAAMEPVGGRLYTVDTSPNVPVLDPYRHTFVHKNVFNLTAADLDGRVMDLVFFDAHVLEPQMHMYNLLLREGLISNETVIALHDTGLHPAQVLRSAYEVPGGWVHQRVERVMVNALHSDGWDAWSMHTPHARLAGPPALPFRHGLTIMQRFARLAT